MGAKRTWDCQRTQAQYKRHFYLIPYLLAFFSLILACGRSGKKKANDPLPRSNGFASAGSIAC